MGEGVGREVDGVTLFKGRQVSLQEENDLCWHTILTHIYLGSSISEQFGYVLLSPASSTPGLKDTHITGTL